MFAFVALGPSMGAFRALIEEVEIVNRSSGREITLTFSGGESEVELYPFLRMVGLTLPVYQQDPERRPEAEPPATSASEP